MQSGASDKTIQITQQRLTFLDEECKVITFRDITAHKELRKAVEHNKMTEMMISNVTHEYLTPIRCINNLSGILYDNVDLEQQANAKMI